MTTWIGTVLCLSVVGGLAGCDQSPTAPTPTPTTSTTPVVPSDFTGQVLIPTETGHSDGDNRNLNRPVSGVTVSIVTGSRSGESVETDDSGRYSFPEFEGDEIHLRLEKDGYETKEAIVHRARPTTLPDRVLLEYRGAQDESGTVLIGRRWPDYVRPVLGQMEVAPDLLLIMIGGGSNYSPGVVEMEGLLADLGSPSKRTTMAHEVCHAHQHWRLRPRGSNASYWADQWKDSPEGLAYQAAIKADIKAVGEDVFDLTGRVSRPVYEGAAEVCASWWGDVTGGRSHHYSRDYLQRHAPNRFLWAEEWLLR